MWKDYVSSVRLPFYERKEGKAGGQGSILRVLVPQDFLCNALKKHLKAVETENAGKVGVIILLLEYAGQQYLGWHGDIKPSNILLFGSDLKLVDFGFTNFRIDEKDEVEAEISQYLNKGNNTYSAPELASKKFVEQDVKRVQSTDIWSLGCVLSVAATWIVLGSQGVEGFSRFRSSARKSLIPAQSNNAFHNGTDILPDIKIWHNFLKDHRRMTDPFTPEILDLIEDHLLKGNPEERLDSKSLCTRLGSIIQHASSEESEDIQSPYTCVLKALDFKPPATATRHKSEESISKARTSSETNRSSADSQTRSQDSKDMVDQNPTPEGSIISMGGKGHLNRKPLATRPQIFETGAPKASSSQSGPTTESGNSNNLMTPNTKSHQKQSRLHDQNREQPIQTPSQQQHPPEKIWEVVKYKEDPEESKLYREVFNQILSNYPKVGELETKYGITPIMEAVKERNIIIAGLLLNRSPLTKKDKEGKTVLHHAIQKDFHEEKEFLNFIKELKTAAEKQNPNSEFIDALDNSGKSPLYLCVDGRKSKIATVLLDLGAKFDPKVFEYAAEQENEIMLLVLEKRWKKELDDIKKSDKVSNGNVFIRWCRQRDPVSERP
ncbi:hypothetical protein BP6252_08025 [Coleophoma cylindrospora]|uniref:non-specific serine/threonine protein kinase n=1 Tax=Coleophoma cylindrospora TaxID=1849047 RepID=A0A3D8RBP6_9HELO|nr:hypothetical protein BP6252_08025 [Coleophoma cylindrospora]